MTQKFPIVFFRLPVYALLGIMSIWTIGPIYWAISTSFKPASQLFTIPPTYIPNPPALDNFVEAVTGHGLLSYLRNSIIVVSISTPLSVGVAALTAYGFARYQFRGQQILLFILLAIRMLPGFVITLPMFLIFRNLRLVDNLLGLVIAYTVFNLPFNTWLLQGFFADISKEMEDAALVDGCSPIQVFWKIMLPIAAPGLVAAAIFSLLLGWNEFVFALILTYTLKSQTLPIAIAGLVTTREIYFGALAAAGVIALLPVLIFAIYIQRYLVQGLTAGAVKG